MIGNSLSQMAFADVGAAGAERIFAAAGVPGILAGIEPLKGAGKGYQESMRKFADNWARPQWRSACGALAMLVPGLPSGSRLWFDVADIAALQDGAMERGQTALVRSQAILTLFQAGIEGVQQRGKAVAGDKTMMDALLPALEAMRKAMEGGGNVAAILDGGAAAAHAGMLATIPMQARKGRASYLGGRSIGHQDPGATSAWLLLKAAAETWHP